MRNILNKSLTAVRAAKNKIFTLLVLICSAALFSSYLGNSILDVTNRINQEFWVPYGIQHTTKVTTDGIYRSVLRNGKLVLGNNSSLYLRKSLNSLLDNYSINVELYGTRAAGGVSRGSLLKILLFNNDSGMISFRLSADASEPSALVCLNGGNEDTLAEFLIENNSSGGKGDKLHFVYLNGELSGTLNGRKYFTVAVDKSFRPAFALMSTKITVSVANIEISSISDSGAYREIIREDFKNKRYLSGSLYFYALLFAVFLAALGISLKGEAALALSLSGKGGSGIPAYLALPYLSSVLFIWPLRLISHNGFQMLAYMLIFVFIDGLVKSTMMRKRLSAPKKPLVRLPAFLLYKPAVIMLLSLIYILPFKNAGYLRFICCIYAALLLVPVLEFLIASRKNIKMAQPAILIILSLLVMFSEKAIRLTVIDKILGPQVSRGHSAEDYLGWIRDDMLDYDMKSGPINFGRDYNKNDPAIICFGGSTTEYGTVPPPGRERYDYPYLVSKALSLRGMKYNVINFGVVGWTTFQMRVFLDSYYKNYSGVIYPELALFYIGYNDLKTELPGSSLKEIYEAKKRENYLFKFVRKKLERFRLYGGTAKLINKTLLKHKKRNIVRSVSLKDSAESIDYIVEYFAKKGTKTVFIPEVAVNKERVFYMELNMLRNYIARKSALGQTHYFDPGAYLNSFPVNEIFYDNLHFTERGAEIFAGYIADKLIELKIIGSNKPAAAAE